MLSRLAIVVCLTVLVACSDEGGEQPGPRTMIFSAEETCSAFTEQTTCGHVMCDYIPDGRSFDEVCGPYFQEGITASALDDASIDAAILRLASSCAVAAEPVDSVMEISLTNGEWARVSGPNAWLEEARETLTVACDR